MRASFRIFVGVAFAVGAAVVACGSDEPGTAPADVDAPERSRDAGVDASDPRCDTQPKKITEHPWAITQSSELGKALRNVQGWNGRLYFGYGDLIDNTGPVHVASFDPTTASWVDHLTLTTESIERFVVANGELWAPCSDAHGPEDAGSVCEAAHGTPDHTWTQDDFTPTIHMMDVTERVPGETLLAGSGFMNNGPLFYGAAVWRSLDGGAFEMIFPGDGGYGETTGGPFGSIASLHGVTFAVAGISAWSWDGTQWLHARAPNAPDTPVLLNEFVHPVTIADKIVFAGYGNLLYAFDGATTTALGIHMIETPARSGFTEEPISMFEASEGHLLAVNDRGEVLVSTDLQTFSCIGHAPADVRSVGSLGGVVYFGGANGQVFAYDAPSW